MILKRFNYKDKKYHRYSIPDEWQVSTYEKNMNKFLNCAQCGKEDIYGNMFTSLEVHTSFGIGYMVCSECYREETERRMLFMEVK